MLHIETKINPAFTPEAGSVCLIIQECSQTLQTQPCDTDTAQLQAGATEVETNVGHQEDTASSGAQSRSAVLLQ